MRRILAALAVVALATLPAVAAPTVGECEATDASGNFNDPSAIEAPAACHGNLGTSDADYFAFEVSADQAIVLNVTVQPGTQASVQLFGPGLAAQPCANGACTVTRAVKGTWKFGIIYTTGSSGSYAVALGVAPGAPNVACDDPDAADAAPGTDVTPPLICGGSITAGDEDWFTFQANAGAVISAALLRQPTPGSGLTTLKLKAPNGTFVECTNDAASACSVPAAQAGAWHLGITPRTPAGVGSYIVALGMAEQTDHVPATCEPQEAGTDKNGANDVESNQVCTGKIRDAADVDVYEFEAEVAPGNIAAFAITVAPVNGSTYDVSVFDALDRPTSCEEARATVCTNSAVTDGLWYVRVARGGGAPGPYTLTITTVVGDPSSIQPAIENLLNSTLTVITCEPTDAGGSKATASALPWSTPNESQALCRGSVTATTPDTGIDAYRFRVHTVNATVRVALQPESPVVDLTLTLLPPPGACEATDHDANGQCPAIVSQLGRDGQPDFVDKQTAGGGKSGDWIVLVGRAPGETGGAYELGVSVQNG